MMMKFGAVMLLSCFASASAVAGPYQGGYGGGQWGGKDGTGIEAGKGGTINGSGMCNRCDQIDYDNPQSVTETGPSWSGEYSQTGPIPGGKVTINSGNKTTTYGRSTRGVDADGGPCSCSGGGFNSGRR
jgi:hypothetical protein